MKRWLCRLTTMALLAGAICTCVGCMANSVGSGCTGEMSGGCYLNGTDAEELAFSEIASGTLPLPNYPERTRQIVLTDTEEPLQLLFYLPPEEEEVSRGTLGSEGNRNEVSEPPLSAEESRFLAEFGELLSRAENCSFNKVFPADLAGGTLVTVGRYTSVQTEGAVLDILRTGDFVYQVGWRYVYAGDEDVAFNLFLRFSGYLAISEGKLRLCMTDARVICQGLAANRWANATMAALMASQTVAPDTLEAYRRMLAGEALTVDEFFGIGTFAQRTAAPVYVVLDLETMEFAVSRPFFLHR